MDKEKLEDLQGEFQEKFFSWMLLFCAVLGIGLIMVDNAPPPSYGSLGMLLMLLVGMAWLLKGVSYRKASWFFNTGVTMLVMIACYWDPTNSSDLCQFLVLPIIGAAMTLGTLAGLIMGVVTSLALVLDTVILVPGFIDTYTFVSRLIILWAIAFLFLIARHHQETTITWAWSSYCQALEHLEEARDRQVELKDTLEDLAMANKETIRLNEMLAAARQAVEEARRAKEEFVANVSHELRTPLNMIIGFSDMILESPEVYAQRLPPALMADVAAIKRNSEHLASLVDDVLDLTEADTGRMKLLRDWTSMGEIVAEATGAVSTLFAQKGIELVVEVPEDLSPLYCDHTRIRQVLLNLLSNAGRFTDEGRTVVEVIPRDGELLISVSDTGRGIESEKLAHMFEPFQQGDQSIRRRYGGSGLGLAISKRFVELHGGEIWLESEVGEGTTACFTLPLEEDMPVEPSKRWVGPYQEGPSRPRRPAPPRIEANPQVVVMEEGEALCRLLPRYLDKLEPVHVETAQEACYAVESRAAVALVLNEPPSSVPRTLAQLPDMDFDVPIMSCWVPEQRGAFEELGVQGYLVKPVDRDDLLASIGEVAPGAHSILVVDDDPEARQLFGRMLSDDDGEYRILQAGDGEMALRLLRERQPDLLLLDLMMPHVDGFAVLERKARDQNTCDIPTLILSARDPEREPIISKALAVQRQNGLSARDLALALEAVTQALTPRFGASTQRETIDALPVSG